MPIASIVAESASAAAADPRRPDRPPAAVPCPADGGVGLMVRRPRFGAVRWWRGRRWWWS